MMAKLLNNSKKKEKKPIYLAKKSKIIRKTNRKIGSSCVECGKQSHKIKGSRNLSPKLETFYRLRGVNTNIYKKICEVCRIKIGKLDHEEYLKAVRTATRLLTNAKIDETSFFDAKNDAYLLKTIGLTKTNLLTIHSVLNDNGYRLNSNIKLIDAIGFYLAKLKLGKMLYLFKKLFYLAKNNFFKY